MVCVPKAYVYKALVPRLWSFWEVTLALKGRVYWGEMMSLGACPEGTEESWPTLSIPSFLHHLAGPQSSEPNNEPLKLETMRFASGIWSQ